MILFISRLTALALALAHSASVHAQTTVYVQAGALGPGDGSPSSPYPTIQEGIAHPGFAPGDTVLVGAGTDVERFQIPDGVEGRSGEGLLRTTIQSPTGGGDVVNGSFPSAGVTATHDRITVEGNGESRGDEPHIRQYQIVAR